MTTSTLETISGLVEQINAKQTGIKVAGQWLNISQYHPLAELPKAGQRVDVQVERGDRGAWIHQLDVLDGGQVHQLAVPQPRRGGGGRSYSDPRAILRQSALRSAVLFAAARLDLKSADVLKLAEHMLAWLEQPERKGGEPSA